MVSELQVPIVAAGVVAFVAIDDFQQIPMQAGLIRPEPFDRLGDIKDGTTLAAEAGDRQALAGRKLVAEGAF
jgi:hypothetical protein